VTHFKDEKLKSFIERPVIYVKNINDKTETSLYEREGVEGKLEINDSKHGYRSIHYIVQYQSVYIEIQVRTIFQDAWIECDHEVRYKEAQGARKTMLGKVSGILGEITNQGDELNELMHMISIGKLLNYPDSCLEGQCDSIVG
jgi:ppGpp synthetase/RelA/SpoT-type nucleotidyltranferase